MANDRDQYSEDWGEWGLACFTFKRLAGDKILTRRPDGTEPTAQWHEGFIDINHE